MARAGGRAALGGVLTAAFGYLVWLVDNDFAPWALDTAGKEFISRAALLAVVFVAVVIIAEGVWPAVRVPGGKLYGSIGRDRRAAAAIQGAVVGATVGFFVTNAFNGFNLFNVETLLVLTASGAAGFAIADVLLDRVSPRQADDSTAA
jgi:hypothetical protein